MSAMPVEEFTKFERLPSSYTNRSSRFLLQDRDFQRQYAHLYCERLLTMRKGVIQNAKRKWGSDVKVCKLHQLEIDSKCCIVGTFFKCMELKPNILREISEEHNQIPQPKRDKYISDTDTLILEDELQRIQLIGNIDAQKAITGTVAAILGVENKDGKFEVEDVCFADPPPAPEAPEIDQDKYVVFLSGLGLGEEGKCMMGLQMMVDLITGQLGTQTEQEKYSKVVRVILAGDSLSASTQNKSILSTAKYLSRKVQAGTVEGVKALDDILTQLVSSVPVDVMPGEFDPTNCIWPQQPLHRCMFPQASVYQTMNSVTNPYEADIEGFRMLGTSGQNVSDIFQFTTYEDRLEILEETLKVGHMAPTAPDTLGCYPFYKEDPFIIQEVPHVYFAGNQTKFSSKLYEGPSGHKTLLLTVPRFSKSQSCIIVNLRTLEAEPIVFASDFMDTD